MIRYQIAIGIPHNESNTSMDIRMMPFGIASMESEQTLIENVHFLYAITWMASTGWDFKGAIKFGIVERPIWQRVIIPQYNSETDDPIKF